MTSFALSVSRLTIYSLTPGIGEEQEHEDLVIVSFLLKPMAACLVRSSTEDGRP